MDCVVSREPLGFIVLLLGIFFVANASGVNADDVLQDSNGTVDKIEPLMGDFMRSCEH